jgi:dienelactone hydrolase
VTGWGRAVLILAAAATAAWVAWTVFLGPFPSGPHVPVGYQRCDRLCIERDADALRVGPVGRARAGLVFHGTDRVPPDAYLELAAGVAEGGYLVVVPDVFLHRPTWGSGATSRAIEHHPAVGAWAVGGHGTGGSVAARVAARQEGVVGLALVGALPPEGLDLSAALLETLVVHATDDPVVPPAEVEESLSRLPAGAEVVTIDGGDHHGFGDYRAPGDGPPAAMAPMEQTGLTADAVRRLMARLAAEPGGE